MLFLETSSTWGYPDRKLVFEAIILPLTEQLPAHSGTKSLLLKLLINVNIYCSRAWKVARSHASFASGVSHLPGQHKVILSPPIATFVSTTNPKILYEASKLEIRLMFLYNSLILTLSDCGRRYQIRWLGRTLILETKDPNK